MPQLKSHIKNNKEINTVTIEQTFLVIKMLSSTNPIIKPSYIPSTMTTVLQILNPSGTPSHFTTQQSGVVPTLPLLKFQTRKILTLLVVAQVITPVAVYQL